MSSCDGWPNYSVAVEHLPDRSMQLWLADDAGRISLGTADGTSGLYPLVKGRVADRLGLTDPEFFVQLRIPRPPYVRDGDLVTAIEDDGRRTAGVVRDWIDGSVLVDPIDRSVGGGGLVPTDRVTFPDGAGT